MALPAEQPEVIAGLASVVGAAHDAWQTVAEQAFERFAAADPELALLAPEALHLRAAAASFFARRFSGPSTEGRAERDTNHRSAYAALLHGQRHLVAARLREFIAGDTRLFTK